MTSDTRARSTIESPALQELYAYWESKCAGRTMPSRNDIDPIDIPRLLPNLILFDVEPGTLRLKARLVGTRVVQMYGRDYTGEYLDEIDFGERSAAILHDYLTCVATRHVYVSEHSFWTIRGADYRIERMITPLSDDGETVNLLMAGLDFGKLP